MVVADTASSSGYSPHAAEATRDLAGRLGALIARENGGDLRSAAERLGVQEADLRHLLERRAPRLAADHVAELCAAAVRHFGVDPSWLLTGRYDPEMHREVEEYPRTAASLRDFIAALIRTSERGRTSGGRYGPLPDTVWGVVAPWSESLAGSSSPRDAPGSH